MTTLNKIGYMLLQWKELTMDSSKELYKEIYSTGKETDEEEIDARMQE